MRYARLECTDQEKINSFLSSAQTGFLGMMDENMPYVVPMNFIWYKDSVFFHGASEGKKIDIIKNNPNATFVVSESYGTISHPVPAKTDTAYMSVMLFGKIEFVTDLSEATEVMQFMLNKYVPKYYNSPLSRNHIDKYRSSLGSKTTVFKLLSTSISAKENPLKEEMKYYPGRTIQMDL